MYYRINKHLLNNSHRNPMPELIEYLSTTIRNLNQLLLLVVLSLFLSTCFAERADRDKPILLEADQMLIDDIHKTSTFTGNVHLSQGTMLLQADKVELITLKDGSQQAIAHGNIASFRQKREGLEEYMEGYGERIEYDASSGIVDFHGQARVKRKLDEVRGDHITYNMNAETFHVSGDINSDQDTTQRVRAVLQPKPKQEALSVSPPQQTGPVLPDNDPTSSN